MKRLHIAYLYIVIALLFVNLWLRVGAGEPGATVESTTLQFSEYVDPGPAITVDGVLFGYDDNLGVPNSFITWLADHLFTGIEPLKAGESTKLMVGKHCIAILTKDEAGGAAMTKCEDAS